MGVVTVDHPVLPVNRHHRGVSGNQDVTDQNRNNAVMTEVIADEDILSRGRDSGKGERKAALQQQTTIGPLLQTQLSRLGTQCATSTTITC